MDFTGFTGNAAQRISLGQPVDRRLGRLGIRSNKTKIRCFLPGHVGGQLCRTKGKN